MNSKKIVSLILVLILAVSGAAADGFFSGISVQTVQTSGSFLGGTAASGASLSRGYGYTDMTGKQPDRVQEYPDYCEIQYTYEQVNEDAYRAYADFLAGKGFYGDLAKYTNDYCLYEVYNDNFEFAIAYNWNRQALTVIFYTDLDQDTADDHTRANDTHDDDHHDDDNDGKCTICGGCGYQKCDACSGTGICGSCCGMPTQYVTGYTVDGGTYVTCAGCHGSARCIYCGGTGYQACMFCN